MNHACFAVEAEHRLVGEPCSVPQEAVARPALVRKGPAVCAREPRTIVVQKRWCRWLLMRNVKTTPNGQGPPRSPCSTILRT